MMEFAAVLLFLFLVLAADAAYWWWQGRAWRRYLREISAGYNSKRRRGQ